MMSVYSSTQMLILISLVATWFNLDVSVRSSVQHLLDRSLCAVTNRSNRRLYKHLSLQCIDELSVCYHGYVIETVSMSKFVLFMFMWECLFVSEAVSRPHSEAQQDHWLWRSYNEMCEWHTHKQHSVMCSLLSSVSLYQAVWSSDGEEVVYPCHAIIVSMTVSSRHQRFFIGHTDKVCHTWHDLFFTFAIVKDFAKWIMTDD